MKIDVIDNGEDFAACRAEWNALLSRSSANNVFLTHEWLTAWWDIFGASLSLFVVAVRDDTGLIGIAPLYKEETRLPLGPRITRLGLIGDKMVGSDYLDLIVDRNRVEETLEALWTRIVSNRTWNAFSLNDVDDASPTIPLVQALAARDGYRHMTLPSFPCPWMPLPATCEEFMDQPDRIFKRIVHREGVRKVTGRHQVVHDVITDSPDMSGPLQTLFALHATRFRLKGIRGSLEDPTMKAFYRRVVSEVAPAGWLRLSSLKIDDRVEAMEFGLNYGRRYYALQGGCSEHGLELRAGNILQYKVFESVIGNTDEFHFLRGAERYKYQWGCQDKHTVNLLLGRDLKGSVFLLCRYMQSLRRSLGEKLARLAEDRQRARAKRRDARSLRKTHGSPTSAGAQLQITRVTTVSEFRALHDRWNRLLARSPRNHVFLTHEWLSAWWDVFGEQLSLSIITVYEGKHLVGIAPLYREQVRLPLGLRVTRVGLIGDKTVGSDYLEFIVEKMREEKVMKILCDSVLADTDWQAISLHDVIADSPIIPAMRSLATNAGHVTALIPCFPCPWMPLPETWNEFINQPDSVFKRIIERRHIKKAVRLHDVDFRSASSAAADPDEMLEMLFSLHAQRWKLKRRRGALEAAPLQAFYRRVSRDLAVMDWLRLSQLTFDGHAEAMEYGIHYNGCYYMLQSGCSKTGLSLRAGNILQYRIFQSLIGHTSEFHYLRGAERYKYLWGCTDKWTVSLTVGRGTVGRLYVLVARLRQIKRRISETLVHPNRVHTQPRADHAQTG